MKEREEKEWNEDLKYVIERFKTPQPLEYPMNGIGQHPVVIPAIKVGGAGKMGRKPFRFPQKKRDRGRHHPDACPSHFLPDARVKAQHERDPEEILLPGHCDSQT